MMRTPDFRAAAPVLALVACATQPAAPIAAEGVESTFEFLLGKYDRDGDGAIAAAEYTREGEGFARLDVNGDGSLTSDDFPADRWSRDLGIRDMPAPLRERAGARYAARAVVLAYFRPQPIAGDPVLSREALEQGFARLDHDGSGALDAAEFDRATAEVRWGGPGDAWELLLAGVDVPPAPSADSEPGTGADSVPPPSPDGRVALAELLDYHAGMAGKDGLLRGPPGVDPLAAGPGLAGDGPPVGSLAPDFELAPPDGGARIRLSAWRGKRPVALVFGSYT